jgi:uncharacterized protein YecE (DUF72 family)
MHAPFLFVGTAGWSIPASHAARFPGDGTHLQRYARIFDAAEINSSFYRPRRRATYEKWAGSVPDHFRFAVKLPKAITHQARLIDCDLTLDRFLGEATGLGEKLGVLLVQLPPSLVFEPEVADGFFNAVRLRTAIPIVCEPRHASWFALAAERLLLTHTIGRVAADPPPATSADEPGGWPGIAYYRLHGSPRIYYSNYEPERLAAQQRRMQIHLVRGGGVWCIFDNTALYAACGNALDLRDRSRAAR